MGDDLRPDPTLPCLVCGKPFTSVFQTPDINQPCDGTAFTTQGHYGSTVFDPMDSTQLEVNVCDPCLTEHHDRVHHIDRDGNITAWDITEEADRGH